MRQTLTWGIIAMAALILFAVAFPSQSLLILLTQILIMGLFATSLNLLVGYTGMVAFGHAAFFGIGAYSAAIFLQKCSSSLILAFGLAVLLSSLAALVIGYFCTRLGSIYFSMLTLAFNQIVYTVVIRWRSMTGGDQGLIGGIPSSALHLFGNSVDISTPKAFFIFTAAIVIISLIICNFIVNSPFGVILRVIRDNANRAYSLGIRVKVYQLIIFIVGGLFAGVSGVLMALFVSGAYPGFCYWAKSAEPIFMVVMGGIGSFLGPMVGAAIFTGLIAVCTLFTNLWGLVIGVVLVLFIVLVRKGLVDYLKDLRTTRAIAFLKDKFQNWKINRYYQGP